MTKEDLVTEMANTMRRAKEVAGIDMVHHPPHYTAGNIECIDALREQLGSEQFIGFLRGTVAKYLWRMPHKGNSLEDARKARWYLNRLIEELGGTE